MPFPRRASHGVFCLVWLSPKHGSEMRNYIFYIPLYFLIISLVTALYLFNPTKYTARGELMSYNQWIFSLIGRQPEGNTVCQPIIDPTLLNISVKYSWMLLTLKLTGSWDFIDKLIWDHDTFCLCDQGGSSQKYAPWEAMYPTDPIFTLENAFQKCPHCN